eukprot:gnl/TRDRNA2_/TRDRNA2_154900_c0_seq1.p1 gnl/TRDRNA2_/TRDRNA2_154900_c0~~gnl/TRDRNA2_/TRDRNA2_154900_c0_seq1.p1  ORF type:complete len:381 (-),score=49.69 gnl/TRDRNA2_/TRDRNA2_154900_c0_seq1:52-1194(-)
MLVGGPDWPTSVLAGIMKLSLIQCLIGTLPVIFFLVPCAFTGSFYLKASEGGIWESAASLMILSTSLVCSILWVVCAWSIQENLDSNPDEIFTRPLVENVDLDWLDYRDEEIARILNITWNDVPRCVGSVYVLGSVVFALVCQFFWWQAELCFGSYEVNSREAPVIYGGPDALLTSYGVVGLSVIVLCMPAWLQYIIWHRIRCKKPRAEALKKLSAVEETWKLERVEKARSFRAGQRSTDSTTDSTKEAEEVAVLPDQDQAVVNVQPCTGHAEEEVEVLREAIGAGAPKNKFEARHGAPAPGAPAEASPRSHPLGSELEVGTEVSPEAPRRIPDAGSKLSAPRQAPAGEPSVIAGDPADAQKEASSLPPTSQAETEEGAG